MAKPVAVLVEVEGLAGLGVVVTLSAPVACVKLNVRVVSLGVVKGVTTTMDFFSSYEVGRGILEDYLWGEMVVGVGLGEGSSAVTLAFLELKEILLHFCDMVGRAADVRQSLHGGCHPSPG